jgi:hypothetical protein
MSTIAVFLALGGVSWAAATLPKNSVGTKQIKKNAVTGSKVKKNTLTGSDIKESKLAQVPSAARADSAASADTATTATTATTASDQAAVIKRVDTSNDNGDADAAKAAATEIPLASNGSISVYGKCYSSGGGVYGSIFVRTSQNGAILNSTGGVSYSGSPSYLDTGTDETLRFLAMASTGADTSTNSGPAFPTVIFGPDGKGFNGVAAVSVRNGNPPGGAGPFSSGSSCVFTYAGAKLG